MEDSLMSLADRLYSLTPPSRSRSPSKPMSVLALGLSRTGTDSLRTALLQLGYCHCYHGQSVVEPDGWHDSRAWYELLTRKTRSGAAVHTGGVSVAEFDRILGHCMAVTDIPAVIFAGELLDAYPDAKVILNRRSDIMEWKKSFRATTLAAERSWVMWICSFFNSELFWMQSIFTLIIQNLFEGDFESNAEIAYLRHYEKLEEKLKRLNRDYLDWEAQQGWEPLCKFLGKDIPGIEFPRKNARAEHDLRIAELVARRVKSAFARMLLIFSIFITILLTVWMGSRFKRRS